MIWGEPTKASNCQPLAPDQGKPLQGQGPRRPAQVRADPRRLLRRAQAASKRNLVIGGNTFTVGTVAPLRWIRRR